MTQQAFVQNAADPQQVKEGGTRAQILRRRELDDVRFLLANPSGRRFIWRLLEHCSVFKTIWHPSALIHHNSGKQDVGHFIMGEVTEADAEAFIQMMVEAKQTENNNG
jgi:hypothetical protein